MVTKSFDHLLHEFNFVKHYAKENFKKHVSLTRTST